MNTQYIINIVLISIIILIFILCKYILTNNKIDKMELNLKEYEIRISSEISDDTFELLDNFISREFSDYIVLNVAYRNLDYINDDLQDKIRREVAYNVTERMSSTLLSKLSVIYNTSIIEKIIAEKVYITTMSYVLEKNSIK